MAFTNNWGGSKRSMTEKETNFSQVLVIIGKFSDEQKSRIRREAREVSGVTFLFFQTQQEAINSDDFFTFAPDIKAVIILSQEKFREEIWKQAMGRSIDEIVMDGRPNSGKDFGQFFQYYRDLVERLRSQD